MAKIIWIFHTLCIYSPVQKKIYSPYESHDSNSLERLSDRVSKWCVSVSGQTDARHRPSAVTGRRRFRACHSIFSCYAPYYVFLRFRRCDQFYKRETQAGMGNAGKKKRYDGRERDRQAEIKRHRGEQIDKDRYEKHTRRGDMPHRDGKERVGKGEADCFVRCACFGINRQRRSRPEQQTARGSPFSQHENVIPPAASGKNTIPRIFTVAPIRCRSIRATEKRQREKNRERERESKPCRCRYLPATFLYCKRQGALKVNPANRAEATCFGNLGIVRYPARCTSENCIPSSSLSLSGNCSTPSPSPFSSTVLLRLPFLRKATYLCTRAILSVPRRASGDRRSHFLQTHVVRSLEDQGCYNFSRSAIKRNIKIHLRSQ